MFASYSLGTKGIKRWLQAICLAQEEKKKDQTKGIQRNKTLGD